MLNRLTSGWTKIVLGFLKEQETKTKQNKKGFLTYAERLQIVVI